MAGDSNHLDSNAHDHLKGEEGLSSFNGLATINYQGHSGSDLDVSPRPPAEPNRDGNPAISDIISDSPDLAPADFLYAREFGKVPNNRMVICRRFHYPVHDILPPFPPISKAVTWLDRDVENIIPEMNLSMNFKDVSIEEGTLNEISSAFGGLGRVGASLSSSGENFDFTGTANLLDEMGFTSNMKESRTEEILGAINLTDSAKFRDLGQESDISFEYEFTYEMKYVDGVDPKIALLDALANAVALVYDNSRFYRLSGSNELVFEDPDQYKKYDMEHIREQLSGSFKAGMMNISERFKEGLDVDGSLSERIEEVFNAGLKMTSTGRMMTRRLYYLYTFITGAPTGFWHLTVGNPFNPIAVWGNLVCTDATIQFSNTLGEGDFPDGFSMTVTLIPARALSRDELLSKFNNASGGIYRPPGAQQPGGSPQLTDAVRNRWMRDNAGKSAPYNPDLVRKSLEMLSGT